MKSTQLALALTLLTGLASLSFAGPGPQFWAAQAKAQPARIESKSPAVVPAATCASCACCAGAKKA
jgi:hypothetical protein